MQRHPAFAIPLTAAHVGAAEAARTLHPHALCPRFHGRGDRSLHRSAERDPSLKLIGYALGQKLCIRFRVLDLDDIQLDLTPSLLLEETAQPLHLGTAAPNNNPGPRSMDVDAHPLLPNALNLDARNGSAQQLVAQCLADGGVLNHLTGVLLVAVPPRLPVGHYTETEPIGVHLLTHQISSSSSRLSPTTMVT